MPEGVLKKGMEVAKNNYLAKQSSTGTVFKDVNIGGRLVRITSDKSGNVLSQADLGPAGDTTGTDRKNMFIQYIAANPDNYTTKEQFEKAAAEAGIPPQDKDIQATLDSLDIKNKPGWLRRFFSGE